MGLTRSTHSAQDFSIFVAVAVTQGSVGEGGKSVGGAGEVEDEDGGGGLATLFFEVPLLTEARTISSKASAISTRAWASLRPNAFAMGSKAAIIVSTDSEDFFETGSPMLDFLNGTSARAAWFQVVAYDSPADMIVFKTTVLYKPRRPLG